VIKEMPFDRKQLKAYIKQNDIGTLEIKKRGADITPEELRKELSPKGKNKATLIITRIGDAHRGVFTLPHLQAHIDLLART
jgi:hypothetical protein